MRRLESDLSAAIFDALNIGLALLDGDKRVIAWNSWLAVASGITAETATGRRLDAIFPNSGLRRLDLAISEALETGTARLLTHSLHPSLLPLRTPAGRSLVHNILVQPVCEKPASKCLVQVTDVTVAARRAEILRERQNARYASVVDSAPDAILTLDAAGLIQFANPAATREFGYASQELVGHHMGLLLEEEAWGKIWPSVLGGEPVHGPVEVVARRKDGSPSYLEISASRWTSDSRVFVTIILRDVNERRAVEEALRTLNQTLERRVAERTADRDRMWRLSTDVMIVAQLNGTINAINPAWTQLFGWDEAGLVGSSMIDFIHPEDRDQFQSILRDLSTGGAPKLFELRLQTHDYRSRRIEWSAVAADGLLQAVGRDVTAEREAEQALQKAEEALRQAQKMEAIGQLTGGIAHDFNNLLTGIIGSMHILKRRVTAGRYDDAERFMDAAVASANRAAALTHRLLAFARRQPLDLKAVDANQMVRGMEELLHRTLGEQVELTTDLEPALWPAFTDAHQLENAILNLAINARDAMPDGGRLTITTRNAVSHEPVLDGQEEIPDGNYTVICVSDTGAGMPPDVITKAFEPFFTTKPIGQGTGLGLSMIYGFTKQSRGAVRIQSTVGHGTTVSLYLPRHNGPILPPPDKQPHEVPKGDGETVLLVEDDSSVRLLIGEVLRELGYACIEASEGQAALPILISNTRLDLMITDVGLPGLSGRQLATVARQYRPELKILFVTGYAEHATGHTKFLEPGMEMVTKPFALDALALKIREMILQDRAY